MRDIENLFDEFDHKDYYKLIKTKSGFDNKNNYMEYESKGDKDKKLSLKEFFT